MSAWMITDAHADFLATAYRQFVDPSIDPQEFGHQLLVENARSLRARYENRHGMARDGEAQAAAYGFRPWAGNIDPENANKQAACAAYQCCEHDEWNASDSAQRLQMLTGATGGEGVKWSDFYPWGIDEHAEDAAHQVEEPPVILVAVIARSAPEQLHIPLWQ